MEDKFDSRSAVENLRKENVSRDQIALQALLRVAALERTLIDNGVIKEIDLAKNLKLLADDLANVIKSGSSHGES